MAERELGQARDIFVHTNTNAHTHTQTHTHRRRHKHMHIAHIFDTYMRTYIWQWDNSDFYYRMCSLTIFDTYMRTYTWQCDNSDMPYISLVLQGDLVDNAFKYV